MNDVTLNTMRINAFKPEFRNVVEDQPYTREQIKLLLDKAEPRNRAIILLLRSSGMRVGALQNLKVGDLTPIDKYNIYQIQVYKRSKSSISHISMEQADSSSSIVQFNGRSASFRINEPIVRHNDPSSLKDILEQFMLGISVPNLKSVEDIRCDKYVMNGNDETCSTGFY